MTIKLPQLKDTEQFAKQVASRVEGGDVIALVGPLGAGKTTFIQSFAKSLGVKSAVKSPTFTVMQTHPFKKLTLCHVDAYRIKDDAELAAIGLYDYLGQSNAVTVIEWADLIKETIPKGALWLTFAYSKDGRSVRIGKR